MKREMTLTSEEATEVVRELAWLLLRNVLTATTLRRRDRDKWYCHWRGAVRDLAQVRQRLSDGQWVKVRKILHVEYVAWKKGGNNL